MEHSKQGGVPVEVQLEHRYECPICLSCLKEPVLTKCGHHFCKDCIRTWMDKKSDTCPIDGLKLAQSDLFPDQFTWREINNKTTTCTKCSEKILTTEMNEHECVMKKQTNVECDFKSVGCCVVGSSGDILEHMNSEVNHHLTLLHNSYLKSFNQESTFVLKQETQFWDPDSKTPTDKGANSQTNMMPLIKSMYERIVVLEQRSLEQNAQIQKLKTDFKNVSLRLEDCKLENSNGEYLWIVNDFTNKLTAMQNDINNMYYSAGFFTSPVGYKICARVNLSHSSDNQLSLLIHIMKSSHDFALDWPFNGRISLIIVHPNNSDLSVKETMISRPELDAFKRPVSEFNLKAFGYTEFISVHDILRKGFLENDCLIIKIIVQCV